MYHREIQTTTRSRSPTGRGDYLKRVDILSKKEIILQWVECGITKREISRRLQCDIKTVDRYLKLFGREYHGKQGWSKGKTLEHKSMSFETYVNRDGVNLSTNKIRKKLLKDGLKEARCERCGNTEWEGLAIPLEVHHIDGNKHNNSLSNLQLLCPNCHALTPTYRGRNIKK